MQAAKTLFQKIGLRAVDLINVFFSLTCLIITIFFSYKISNIKTIFLFYFFLVLLIPFFIGVTKNSKNTILLFIRDWYSPIIFTFYYENTYTFAKAVFDGRKFDSWIAKIDELIFGFQPSLIFSVKMPQAWFSEFLHLSYTSYYLMIPIVGGILWFTNRKKEFDKFIFGCVILMLLCYLIFSLFPVAGPIWYFDGASRTFSGYVFVKVIDYIVKNAEIPNAAFPSSHVALSFYIILFSFVYIRKIFWLLLPFFIGLCFATVYIMAHYFIDVPAGILYGLIFFLISDKIKKVLEEKLFLCEE